MQSVIYKESYVTSNIMLTFLEFLINFHFRININYEQCCIIDGTKLPLK